MTASAHRAAPAELPDRIRHHIDGVDVDSVDGGTFEVLDPVTDDPGRPAVV